jgi:small subunit ribosomal protein S20
MQVVKLSEALVKTPVAADAPELQQIEQLVTEAYKEIDKAVKVGTLHKNTGDRRKARVAKYKRQALIAAGAYVPTAEQPGFSFYQRMQAKSAKAEAAQ